MKRKKNTWVLARHKIIRAFLYPLVVPFVKRKYNVKIEKVKKGDHRQYLILSNHQTAFDQFFVGAAFRDPLYFVATEDIFSLGFLSKLIKFCFAPIPIKKQVSDVGAVLSCKRVVKEGGSIAMFPEGNRTYSGQTEYINPAIAGLAKLLKLPIAFFKIEGGYGVHPRWADDVRKGTKMRAYVSKVVEVEEYAHLENDELNELIRKELYVDDTAVLGEYKHKRLAENLERAIYVCPHCGLSEFESKFDTILCKKCNLTARYLPNKTLQAVQGALPFTYVKDWYRYQEDFINRLDLSAFGDEKMFSDEGATLFDVLLYKKKEKVSDAANISAYNDKIVIAHTGETLSFPYDKITALSVLGKNKLNIYCEGKVYQIKGKNGFNAVKYVNTYYHYVSLQEVGGKKNGFLGL